jgi:hypothetical protein
MKAFDCNDSKYLLLDSFDPSLGTESRESRTLSRNFEYLMHESLSRDNHFESKLKASIKNYKRVLQILIFSKFSIGFV